MSDALDHKISNISRFFFNLSVVQRSFSVALIASQVPYITKLVPQAVGTMCVGFFDATRVQSQEVKKCGGNIHEL